MKISGREFIVKASIHVLHILSDAGVGSGASSKDGCKEWSGDWGELIEVAVNLG